MPKQNVAFFDIDGTVFRSSLLIELVNNLISNNIFPALAAKDMNNALKNWQNRTGSYEDYINAVVQVFLKNIKGVHYGTLADIGKLVVSEQKGWVYRYTRDLLIKLKREDYYLVAISQSPKTILDEFCQQFGFDKVYGRIYEIGPQDCFTGVVANEHLIANKVNIVKRVMEKHPQLTLDGSIAVGDTEGDLSLLESVTNPICFNPNQFLYNQAKRKGWEVVVERKDVIYFV